MSKKSEMLRGLQFLYLVVDESVAKDVSQRVSDRVSELEDALKDAINAVKYDDPECVDALEAKANAWQKVLDGVE
jgi:hypothetical protein